MKYPQLVPDRVCTTPITVYRESGLNRDGSPIITLNAVALFNGDIAPDSDTIEGDVDVLSGIHRRIYASQKCRNPDGTVNYTRLELI